MRRISLVTLCVLAAVGCQSEQHPDVIQSLSESRPTTPVIQINDYRVDVNEFQVFWSKNPELSRDEAKTRFEEQTLAAERALAATEQQTPELQMARKREMIRLMLAEEVERETGEVTQAMLDEVAAELRSPRGFRASHILVMSKTQEAIGSRGETIARQLATQIDNGSDALDLVRLQREFPVDEDLRLHVDLHMVFPASGQMVATLPGGWTTLDPAFVTAIEGLKGPGVTAPFESRFGWHIAILHAELPAVEPDPKDVQILAQHRVDTLVRTERYSNLIAQEKASAHYNTYPRVVRERAEERP